MFHPRRHQAFEKDLPYLAYPAAKPCSISDRPKQHNPKVKWQRARCRKVLVSMCFQSTHAVLRAQRKRMSYRLPVSAAILLQRIRYSFPSLVGLTSCRVLVCIGRIDKHELLSADTASKTFGGKTSSTRWQTHCKGSHDSYPAETMPF